MLTSIEGYRLSPQQRRIWELHQGEGVFPYRVQAMAAVEGPFDADVLREAVSDLVRRHESLRTAFRRLPGMAMPVQVIGEEAAPDWREEDLSNLSPAKQEAHLERLGRELLQRSFDPVGRPLLDVTCVRLAQGKALLLFTLPALNMDGAFYLLLREIAASYERLLGGHAEDEEEEEEEEIIPYVALADWFNEMLEGEDSEDGRAYWRRRNPEEALAERLPFSGREPGASFAPQRLVWRVSSELQGLLEAQSASVSGVLLAAWQGLLGRLTGQERVVVGAYADGRADAEIAGTVGPMGRYVPVQGNVDPGRPFQAVIDEAASNLAELADWCEMFDWEEGSEAAGAGRTPYFPFGYDFCAHEEVRTGTGVSFALRDGYACLDRFQMRLAVQSGPHGLRIDLCYDAAEVTEEEAKRVLGCYQRFLENTMREPHLPLGCAALLGDEERRLALTEWNGTDAGFPGDITLHGLFEQRAAMHPERIAVLAAGERLTYGELNARANRLARLLRERGVTDGSTVGIGCERSLELVVGMLAVQKAGGAYLPLDSDYPQERLAFMIEDSQTRIVLTQERVAERFAGQGAELLCLDVLDCPGEEGPVRAVSPDQAAYVIYTSGSTGRPKGVVVPHRAACNHMLWMLEEYPLGEGDRVLQKTAVSFDASVWEFYAPLAAGAQLVMASPGAHLDPAALIREVRDGGITVLQVVPAMLRMLLDRGEFAACTSLRLLYSGGERLSGELRDRFFARFGTAELVNLYGPTECAIDAASWRCSREETAPDVPIGRPVANTKLYVLDERMEPVPQGVAGELYIGGAQLALGYLHRPQLTAEKFVNDPFAAEPGRLYRTGDLVRRLPNGALHYLGRTDGQVKLRGFRIELGEIERIIEQHPEAAQAVVLLREDAPGDQRLVAYCTAAHDLKRLASADLRRFVKERAPEHMVPSHVVMLESFPLTPNGKVDHRALPKPEELDLPESQPFVAPRTGVEELLAGIWEQTLGREKVGIHDNFFELGGHSLLATQVIARLRDVFGIDLPLRGLFADPTVAGLAVEVEAARRNGRRTEAPPIMARSEEGERELSFAQQRLWFLEQMDPDSPLYNMIDALRLQGRLDIGLMERCLNEIVRRHAALRTRFVVEQGVPKQAAAPAVTLDLPLTDLAAYGEEERERLLERLVRAEAQQAFDLGKGPLIRTKMLRVSDDEHVLVITTHHIVNDGWSRGVITDEIAALYEAFGKGEPSSLPELPIQYADFADWQRAYMSGDVLDEQLAYWKGVLGGPLPMLNLPTDRPRPAKQTFRGALYFEPLPQELRSRLERLSRNEGATLFMTLLTGFKVLLMRYSGQEDVLVGSAIANRNRAEIAGLIGFFVNTLGLRTDLSGNPAFLEALRRVRETALGAYAHQDLPFERLVEELQPERDTTHSPLFRVLFVLHNVPAAALELSGLTMTALPVDNGTSKFDLTLAVNEEEDGLVGEWEYNTDLFDRETIVRMAEQYRCLLEAVAEEPSRSLADLPLLREDEAARLLAASRGPVADYPREKSIPDLFALQAAQRPDHVAVSQGGVSLTYRELNERANRTAHVLLARGVQPGTSVGVAMQRSPELVAALLGIMKAGAAYVPLDPGYPQERLAFMQNDAGIELLLTHEEVSGKGVADGERVLCFDRDRALFEAASTADPAVAVRAEDPAYVLYTSGTTGRPKGVIVPHRAVVRLVTGTDYVRFSPHETFLQLSSISFDAATFELWGALLHGAKLLLFPPHRPSLSELGRTLREEGVTTLWLTAGLFHQMVDAQLDDLRGVRQLIAGGDVLSPKHVQHLRANLPDTRLINGYGPTEGTTFTCTYEVTDAPFGASLPIGKPIANTEAYVLDSRRQPLPVGVPGELYIGGDGLATGYLNLPELTAERFVPHPFANGEGARLYRTGDLVRRLPDGNLEFLGRLDQQVKIRGYRIETGEIEAALNLHPHVREAVVAAKDDESGGKRLVAYVIPDYGAMRPEPGSEQQDELVSDWEMVFDDYLYAQETATEDETFNIIGWNSTFTGEPLPQDEMSQWLDATISRIRTLRPNRVLEIGCGTGMLLYRLAPGCASYFGTDISSGVVDRLRGQLAGRGGAFDHVALEQRRADNFAGIEAGAFDTVVMNSVVQYFPNAEYLTDVLAGGVRAVAGGGTIIIGDVRSLPLLETFHAAVALAGAPDAMRTEQLVQRAQSRMAQDGELVLDPAYFHRLREQLPQITHVDVLLKQGRYVNELSQYRYDVILHVGGDLEILAEPDLANWQEEGLTLSALRGRLLKTGPESLVLHGVPDARVHRDVKMMQWLAGDDRPATVGELRKRLREETEERAVDPADLWALGDELGYDVQIARAHSQGDGTCDALFRKRGGELRPAAWPCRTETEGRSPGSDANHPLRHRQLRHLVPALRRELEERLPEHMIPNAFVVMDDLPLTANGKVDRRALPEPDKMRPDHNAYLGPQGEFEELVASVFGEVLGLDRIGAQDHFFELGGHSLLATQVISRVREALQIEVSVHQIFQSPTVASFAAALEERMLQELDELTDEEALQMLEQDGGGAR